MKRIVKNRFCKFLIPLLLLFTTESIASLPEAIQYRNARFKDLQSIDVLKKLFNDDEGKVRLFLLMSPT
ncbi:MAG: hypothetical protein IIB40_04930 [Candidatus Marinimicrobia bacterium]|nr:hypothetical protein [Candidatus Neomarinimicrobiota bacterium]MCH7955608.1 hypothetical protein [Candidatus Neomarinimicrobiota bacterium]